MLPFTTQDAVGVLRKSKNLNAALKGFLKREMRNGDPAARFVKDFRDLAANPASDRIEPFVEKSRSRFEIQLIAIGSYAHPEVISEIVSKVAEKYADDFNKTYEVVDDKINVTNKKSFDKIAQEAFTLIDTELEKSGFGASAYLKNVLLLSIFDRPVLEYIFKTLK